MNSIKVREYIRRHVIGMVAIFIALSGTAIAGGNDPTASSSVVTNAKFKKLKQRVAALETKLNSPVTGDLTGTFPNLQIGTNAVGTNEIATNAVTNPKIADDAVDSAEIAANAVGSAEIAANAVGASEIAADAVGSSEIAGDAVGALELKDVLERDGGLTAVAANSSGLAGAPCNANEQALSGGATWNTTDADVAISQSFKFLNSWFIRGGNANGAAHSFTPIVFCLEP